MPAPRLVRKQTVKQVNALVRQAIEKRLTFSAVYKGHGRLLAPYLLGLNAAGEQRVLCYQTGGESSSGLAARGSPENWRCVAVEQLFDVELRDDPWPAPSNFSPLQTCITQIEARAIKSDKGAASNALLPHVPE